MIADAETTTIADTLRRSCREAVLRARRHARPVVVSQTVEAPLPSDPVELFDRGCAFGGYRAYWEQPAEGFVLVGIGAVRTVRCDGPTRFRAAAAALRADISSAVCDGPIDAPGGPIYLSGFAFDPETTSDQDWDGFPDGLLLLPRLLLAVESGRASITVNAMVEADADFEIVAADALRDLAALQSDGTSSESVVVSVAKSAKRSEFPDPEDWKAEVAAAAADVRSGRIEKVVLARALRLQTMDVFDPGAALRRLRGAGPAATLFAFGTADRCFLGATPERLVRLAAREVSVDCIAGSIARGATDDEDERLAQMLLASEKDRTEHEVVVHAVTVALSSVCDELIRPSDTPRVVRSRNVQHLSTPLRGRLSGGNCVLDLVERLHPTPAVGGFPRELALEAIREREGFDRGWYAGPLGWVNGEGEGEFAVAIRSALLAGNEATLYAGAGIVADSDPDAEYAETGLKLKPMLAALGATG